MNHLYYAPLLSITDKKEAISVTKYSYLSFLLVLLLLLVLVSCEGGSYTIISGDVDAKSNSIEGHYKLFSGHYYKEIRLNPDDKVVFDFSHQTESGEISMTLNDSDGETVFKLDGKQDPVVRSYTANKADRYRVTVHGNEHEGQFELKWDIQ